MKTPMGDLVIGSDRVRIETRDRFQSAAAMLATFSAYSHWSLGAKAEARTRRDATAISRTMAARSFQSQSSPRQAALVFRNLAPSGNAAKGMRAMERTAFAMIVTRLGDLADGRFSRRRGPGL